MSKDAAQMPQTDISYLPTLDSLLSLAGLSEGCGWNLSAETYTGFRLPGSSLMFFEVKIALNGQEKSILLICFDGLNLGKDIDFVLKAAIYDNQTGSFFFCVCDRTLATLLPPSSQQILPACASTHGSGRTAQPRTTLNLILLPVLLKGRVPAAGTPDFMYQIVPNASCMSGRHSATELYFKPSNWYLNKH